MSRSEPVLLIRGARVARCEPDVGVIDDGAVAVDASGNVVFVGPAADAPAAGGGTQIVYARGALLTPGLVDPHTHLVFAGRRTSEFEQKMRGVDYRTIAANGGGIQSTVNATRAADEGALLASTKRRLQIAIGYGVTTIEVKSGYDLTLEGELRLLRIARAASEDGAPMPRVATTLLGAHTVPREHQKLRGAYVSIVKDEMIPAVAREGLASMVDVYLDEGAFTTGEARAILSSARQHGLAVRAHVGQFRDVGGAELVAELGGLSCDHLEEVGDAGLLAMGRAGTMAVLLPAAWRTLRQSPPDAARMRAAGVSIAIGTDANPGTSPCLDLPMCAALAVRDADLDPQQALLAITRHAARAIGARDAGRIAVGVPADLALWDHDDPAMFAYAIGGHRPTNVWVGGRIAVDAPAATSAF